MAFTLIRGLGTPGTRPKGGTSNDAAGFEQANDQRRPKWSPPRELSVCGQTGPRSVELAGGWSVVSRPDPEGV
jgi:hypothetical protein